jgi:Spherulation-specific family 4
VGSFLRAHLLRGTVLLTLLFLSVAPAGAGAQAQYMAVPAYFYPGPYWSQMAAAGATVRLAVMNPASGPGTAADREYVSAVGAAHAAGIAVVGYVHTSYATRSPAAAKADIDAYYRWYHVDGIFFDEASTDCVNESYYASLNAYVKAKGGIARTILNPGTATSQCYVSAADILVTFEGSYSQYVSSYSAPAWLDRYPAGRFWHVVYATPSESAMTQAVRLSKTRRAGYVYVTPETLPNPYEVLPAGAYWSDALGAIRSP